MDGSNEVELLDSLFVFVNVCVEIKDDVTVRVLTELCTTKDAVLARVEVHVAALCEDVINVVSLKLSTAPSGAGGSLSCSSRAYTKYPGLLLCVTVIVTAVVFLTYVVVLIKDKAVTKVVTVISVTSHLLVDSITIGAESEGSALRDVFSYLPISVIERFSR